MKVYLTYSGSFEEPLFVTATVRDAVMAEDILELQGHYNVCTEVQEVADSKALETELREAFKS